MAGLVLKRAGRSAGVALALCFFILGVLRTGAALYVPQPAEGKYQIEATVSGEATVRDDERITFALQNICLDGTPVRGKAYASLYFDQLPPALFDGARVHFEGRVYLPDGRSGAPHTDFRLWMRQNGYAFGISSYNEPFIANTPSTAPVASLRYRILSAFERALQRTMGDHSRIAMALLFGSRDGLTEEETESFRTLGIAHVMSVSGLHVSILASMIAHLLHKLHIRRRMQLAAVMLFLFGYCALTGFSAAANRAAFTLVCMMSARLVHRKADRLTVLACAMLLVLFIQPLKAHSAGFVLSFSAMGGIILYDPLVKRLLHKIRLPKKFFSVAEGLGVCITAQLGVLLPTAAFFHQLPLYGIFINMLIVPLVSAVLVPLCAVALVVSPLPLLGSLLGQSAAVLIRVLLWLVSLLSRLPCASIRVATPPAMVSIGFGLALAALSPRIPGTFAKRLAAALLAIAVGLGAGFASRPDELRYIQLDAGQADAALVMDGSVTLMIDAGDDGRDVLDYLMAENRDVDALFITHLHMDHIGGVEQLLESPVRIHQVYLPAKAERQQVDAEALALLEKIYQKNIPVSELAMGDELRYNKTAVRVLWPAGPDTRTGHTANEMSLVLQLDLDGFTLLSAADLTGQYEPYAAIPADVLKVAHHGSNKSTSAEFLAFVRPKLAILTTTSGSSYLPGAQTLKRLQESGTQLLRTDECGDITLTVKNGQLFASPYKVR